MKTIKPLKLSVLHRTFEHDRRPRLCITVVAGFRLTSERELIPEMDLWTALGEALAAENGILDEGNVKVRGELLVTGGCHPPDGPTPVSFVRVELGPIDKRLAVLGDRQWRLGVPTEPEPFERMPVDWAHAFGGPGFESNPRGIGHAPIIEADGVERHRLPNIEHPRKLIHSPGDRPEPAGMAALDLTWPQRFSKVGTYDRSWLKDHAFEWAKDMEPTIFNTAPPDQWLEGYFDGDEAYLIENMHPDHPRIAGTLPPMRARVLLTKQAGEPLTDVPTRLDTVRLVPHLDLGVLLFRCVTEVREDDADDVEHLVIAAEDRSQPPTSLEHYQAVLAKRLDKEKAAIYALQDEDLMPPTELGWGSARPTTDVAEWVASERLLEQNIYRGVQQRYEEKRAELLAAGLDPDDFGLEPLPPPDDVDPNDPEAIVEQLDNMEKERQQAMEEAEERFEEVREGARKTLEEQGLDMDEVVAEAEAEAAGPPGLDIDAQLAQLRQLLEIAKQGEQPIEGLEQLEYMAHDPAYRETMLKLQQMMRDGYRRGAHLQGAVAPIGSEASQMFRTEIEMAHLNTITLEDRDFSGADLSGMDLNEMGLQGAFLDSVDLTDTNLRGAKLEDAVLAHANLEGASLAGASLVRCNLGAAELARADLSSCELHETMLGGGRWRSTSLRGATLSKVVLNELELTEEIDLSEVTASESVAAQIDMRAVRLERAKLHRVVFAGVDLRGVSFDGAEMTKTCFVECQLDGASFRGARMHGTQIVFGSTAVEADFRGADLFQTQLRGVDLRGATFEEANLSEADLSKADASGCNLYRIVAPKALMMRTKLLQADLREADLFEAILQKARLMGADLTGANLFGADLARILTDGTTKLDRVNKRRARIHPLARSEEVARAQPPPPEDA